MSYRIIRKFNRIYGPLLLRLGSREPLAMRHWENLCYLIRPLSTDRFIEGEILREAVYGLTIKPGDLVLDGGAHVGLFTLYALQKGASVISVEADQENFTLLTANVNLNPQFRESSRIIPGAISYHHSEIAFYPAKNKGNGSTYPYAKGKATLVQSRTLDDFAPYDVLKLDIEGAEYEAIDAADLSGVREVAIEYHTHSGLGYRLPAMIEKLQSSGLKILRMERNGYNGYLLAVRSG